MYFEEPSAEVPPGVEVFALPHRLTRALANASSTELEALATR